MRRVRRLMLLGSTALLIMSFSAAVASADALRQAGVPMPVGSALNLTSTNATFTGAFPQPVTCANSGMATTITVNNVIGAPVRANLNAWAFAGCTMPGPPPVACNVVVNGLPWPNAVSMRVGPPKTFSVQFPTNGSITITCGGVACTYVGAGAPPPASVTGAWTDSPTPVTPATVTFTNAPLALVAGPCGNPATFSGTYTTTINDLLLTP
jgi:hypothetical protein